MARLTDKQEGFVQSLLKGMSQREAYKENYSANNMKDNTIDRKAYETLKKDYVRARYDELKGKVMQKIEQDGLFEATDVLRKIHDIVVANEKDDPKTALKGLELYGKHLKLFTERVEAVNTNLNVEASEEEAREILKAAGIDPDKL